MPALLFLSLTLIMIVFLSFDFVPSETKNEISWLTEWIFLSCFLPLVQDKEMLHGPGGYGDDEGKFTEYYRAVGDLSIRQSRTSLNNGDDRDSMEEFNEEKDRGRFTEDGSFIGQYGRDDKRRTYLAKYDESLGLTSDSPNTNNQGKSSSPV